MHGGGSAPVADSGRARAWELHRREGNPFRCLAWAGNGRRWGRGVQSRRPASAQRRWRGDELEKIRERATRPREEDKDAHTESEDRRRGDAWSHRRAVGRGMGSTGENME